MSLIGVSLSDVEKELIIDSWEIILEDSEIFSKLFYEKLFEIDSSLRSLFTNNIGLQQMKFVDSVNYLVHRMNDSEEATRKMEKLGLKHKGYSVKSKHYPPFGQALISCFEEHVGEIFTKECKIAWTKLYDSVSDVMIKGTQR